MCNQTFRTHSIRIFKCGKSGIFSAAFFPHKGNRRGDFPVPRALNFWAHRSFATLHTSQNFAVDQGFRLLRLYNPSFQTHSRTEITKKKSFVGDSGKVIVGCRTQLLERAVIFYAKSRWLHHTDYICFPNAPQVLIL
jgi:hypothetical protein